MARWSIVKAPSVWLGKTKDWPCTLIPAPGGMSSSVPAESKRMTYCPVCQLDCINMCTGLTGIGEQLATETTEVSVDGSYQACGMSLRHAPESSAAHGHPCLSARNPKQKSQNRYGRTARKSPRRVCDQLHQRCGRTLQLTIGRHYIFVSTDAIPCKSAPTSFFPLRYTLLCLADQLTPIAFTRRYKYLRVDKLKRPADLCRQLALSNQASRYTPIKLACPCGP